jgi:hypothetical protein
MFNFSFCCICCSWLYCLCVSCSSVIYCYVFVLCLCVICVTSLLYCCTTATGLKPNCSLTHTHTYMFLVMVRNSHNHWIFGLCLSSGILRDTKYFSGNGSVCHWTSESELVPYNCMLDKFVGYVCLCLASGLKTTVSTDMV